MTDLIRPKVVAWMGDSLSAGTLTIGDMLRAFTVQLDVDPSLSPRVAVANSAKSGDTIEFVQIRYTDNVKGQGFDMVALMIGVNNFNVSNQTGAQAWALLNTLIDEIIADGLPVLLVMESGWSNYVNWTSGKQANYEAFRTLLLAKKGVAILDLYQPFPLGMNDPAAPTALYGPFSADGLHYLQLGNDQIAKLALPLILAQFPPVAVVDPGVTKQLVIDLAPELNDPLLTDTDWSRTISWADDETSSRLGTQARKNRAETFLVAHMMTQLRATRHGQTTLGMGQGAVTGVTAGAVNKTFAVNETWANLAITAAVLATTIYGREYLRLIRIFLGAGAGTVAGGLGPIIPRWPNG